MECRRELGCTHPIHILPPLPPPPSLPSLPSCSEEVRVVQTRQSKLYSWWSNLRENNPITNCKGATVIEECVDCVGGHSYRVECRVCVCVHYSVVVTHTFSSDLPSHFYPPLPSPPLPSPTPPFPHTKCCTQCV